MELLCGLYGHDVAHGLHDAYLRGIAPWVGTEVTALRIRDVVTHLTVLYLVLQPDERFAQGLYRGIVLPQQVEH